MRVFLVLCVLSATSWTHVVVHAQLDLPDQIAQETGSFVLLPGGLPLTKKQIQEQVDFIETGGLSERSFSTTGDHGHGYTDMDHASASSAVHVAASSVHVPVTASGTMNQYQAQPQFDYAQMQQAYAQAQQTQPMTYDIVQTNYYPPSVSTMPDQFVYQHQQQLQQQQAELASAGTEQLITATVHNDAHRTGESGDQSTATSSNSYKGHSSFQQPQHNLTNVLLALLSDPSNLIYIITFGVAFLIPFLVYALLQLKLGNVDSPAVQILTHLPANMNLNELHKRVGQAVKKVY